MGGIISSCLFSNSSSRQHLGIIDCNVYIVIYVIILCPRKPRPWGVQYLFSTRAFRCFLITKDIVRRKPPKYVYLIWLYSRNTFWLGWAGLVNKLNIKKAKLWFFFFTRLTEFFYINLIKNEFILNCITLCSSFNFFYSSIQFAI